MLIKYVRFEMTFEGWYGTAKPNIEEYVVPNFRCEITERPLGKVQTQQKPAGAAEGTDQLNVKCAEVYND